MKLPPEFNSWDEVWDEHQLRGKQNAALRLALDTMAREVDTRRDSTRDLRDPKRTSAAQVNTARQATDANALCAAALERVKKENA